LALNQVRKSAEKIRNADPATIEVMSPGDNVRQGDIYIVLLDCKPAEASPFKGRQLAPGNTQGSRHIVEGDCRLFTPTEADAIRILTGLVPATKAHRQFLGPVIVAAEPVTITHPEHGHRTLPAGTYLVTYQRTRLDSELRRAED
jgi:hypothetical protein